METKHKTFKTFDKVLVREGKQWPWRATFYSHYNPISGYHYTTSGAPINDILFYKGNEHLIGKAGEPKEEIRLKEGEYLICFDNLDYFKAEEFCLSPFASIVESDVKTKDGCRWHLFIKFSDFNPNDREETKKHILRVKNGKVVKYKNN